MTRCIDVRRSSGRGDTAGGAGPHPAREGPELHTDLPVKLRSPSHRPEGLSSPTGQPNQKQLPLRRAGSLRSFTSRPVTTRPVRPPRHQNHAEGPTGEPSASNYQQRISEGIDASVTAAGLAESEVRNEGTAASVGTKSQKEAWGGALTASFTTIALNGRHGVAKVKTGRQPPGGGRSFTG